MSGITDLDKLECVTFGVCPLYDASIWGASVTVALDFYPIFLTVGLYAVALYQYELYLALVSFGLTFNWGLSVFLQRAIFMQPGHSPDCGSPFQMPSFSSQLIVMFTTMMSCYMVVWGKRYPGKLVLIMQLFNACVLISRIFIGINTRAQLLAGALVGFVVGYIYHLFIMRILYPYFGRILTMEWIKFLGVVDTMCGSKEEQSVQFITHPHRKQYDRGSRERTVHLYEKESSALKLSSRSEQHG